MTTARDLTTAQKVALLGGADTWHTAGFDDPPVPPLRMSDGPAGVRGTSWSGPRSASFPCGSALGATWDPALIEDVGHALAREARSKSVHVILAPTINLQRTPISGRNFEFPSEDPVLAAACAVAYVRGVQAEGVAACAKHLVGNETEHERMTISSDIDERTLREVYLLPFEAAVREAGLRVVMSAYNRLNGTSCADHAWLLTDVLRGEWGFGGVVVSDWFGCHSTVTSLRAGVDLEMPGPPLQRGGRLQAAIDAGEIAEAELDAPADRLLELGRWTGAATTGTAEVTADDSATRDLIRRAAVRGTVLLKNDAGALPLAVGSTSSLALIGPNADCGRVQGGGSARVNPSNGRGPLAALAARGCDVTFEPGGTIHRFLPALEGDFVVDVADGRGGRATVPAPRLAWFWDGPPAPGVTAADFAARITGTVTVAEAGAWELGVRAVGPVTVRLDDEAVLELPEAETGGTFFGYGSAEHRASVSLEAGRSYRLDVDYPRVAGPPVRGLAVGARPVPPGDHLERAAAVAADADVAVVIVGTDDEWETEGEDRGGLGLPGEQDALVSRVAAAASRTVVVVNAGSPVLMPWLDEVDAVLQVWFPGQEIGDALADVLLGDAEPGGRLPLTFPRRLEDTPAFAHYPGAEGRAVYGEGLHVGHRWYDRHDIEPLFPFGFGLGYTTFDIEPVAAAGTPDGGATALVRVTNTGRRAGSTVVQAYVEPRPDDPSRPRRRLGGFARVELAPGVSEELTVALAPRVFQSWLDGRWVLPAGDYGILVGPHSRALVPAGVLAGPQP